MLFRAYIMSGQCLDNDGMHHVRTGSNFMIIAMLNYSSLCNVYARTCIVCSCIDWQTTVTVVPTSHVRRQAESGTCSRCLMLELLKC